MQSSVVCIWNFSLPGSRVYPLPSRVHSRVQWRGNYFWTGGQDRERQSRDRETKVFAGIRAFFVPKRCVLQKIKKGPPWIRAYFCPENGLGYKSQVGQKSPRVAKISPGGPVPPTFRAYARVEIIKSVATLQQKRLLPILQSIEAFQRSVNYVMKQRSALI